MTLQREIIGDAAVGVGVGKTPASLSLIAKPGCAAAIWERKPLDSFQTWIDALAPDDLPRARIILRPDVVRQAMTDLVEGAGLPDNNARAMLIDDVSAMAKIFADVITTPYLRLRLDVISNNACRKFHIDAIKARLICTYRGSGTQYGISTDGAEPRQIFSVPTGSAMIMRGTLWPETPKSGLLHRSPPIEGTGETRLVLVLDPVEDLEAEQELHRVH